MKRFEAKRVTDPVHGSIGISNLEAKIIKSQAFQRLRNIKQLGLAHYVFPGADYSRLAHSLGVCHVTRRLLQSINLNNEHVSVSEDEIQFYRIAGLLHDIGHYPFSHAMEEPVEDFIKSTTMLTDKVASEAKTPTATGQPAGTDLEYLNHERIAKQILTADPELRRILEDGKIDPSNLYSVILREHPPRFANLISSDLDADRIDYLLRTAHQSGLPYGSVDLNYILSQLRLDSKNRICLSRKALRTADHLLLCRYFDYQQVVFHKTVAAFEMVLKKVISHLLRRGLLDCSREQIVKFIENGKWHEFDDSYVLQKVRELRAEPSISPVERIECDSLLTRTAPKLIAEIEKMDKREESVKKTFRHTRQSVREKTDKWASELGLDPQLIYVWAQPVMTLTKIGSHIPVSYEMTTDDSDKSEQIVRILDADGATSSPIFDVGNSLMNILSNYALYSLRVYALLPEADSGTRRAELATCITRDLPDLEWKTLPASPVHKNM